MSLSPFFKNFVRSGFTNKIPTILMSHFLTLGGHHKLRWQTSGRRGFIQSLTLYRVFRSGMSFSRWLKMTEKRNLHNKTRLLYYQNLPPFHFIAKNPIKIFNKCSKLDQCGITGFCWKIWPSLIWNFSDSVFHIHYGPQSPSMPFIPLGVFEVFFKICNWKFSKNYHNIKFLEFFNSS